MESRILAQQDVLVEKLEDAHDIQWLLASEDMDELEENVDGPATVPKPD